MVKNSIVYVNGNRSSSTDLPKLTGPGLFETIRLRKQLVASNAKIICLGLDLHLQRLAGGLDHLGIACLDFNNIATIITQAVSEFNWQNNQDAKLKLIVSQSLWIILVEPWSFDPNFLTPISCVSYRAKRSSPEIKSTATEVSIQARAYADENNFQEALLVDDNEVLREGAWSNFIWCNDKLELISPQQHILPGITLSIVKDLARKNNLRFIEQDYTISEIKRTAISACITQATHGVVKVKSIDDRCFDVSLANNPIDLIIKHYNELFALNLDFVNCLHIF